MHTVNARLSHASEYRINYSDENRKSNSSVIENILLKVVCFQILFVSLPCHFRYFI